MPPGRFVTWSAALALTLGMGVEPAAAAADREPTQVDVRLTIAPELPPRARMSLAAEVESIWRPEGVQVIWAANDGPVTPGRPSLRVLVLQLDRGTAGRWPVGELLRTAANRGIPIAPAPALAIASIAGARRVLDAAGFPREGGDAGAHRLGVVLGRAVAHELGHYLLGVAHGRGGLMRQRIAAFDFADLRSPRFVLDAAARARLDAWREAPAEAGDAIDADGR